MEKDVLVGVRGAVLDDASELEDDPVISLDTESTVFDLRHRVGGAGVKRVVFSSVDKALSIADEEEENKDGT